MFITPKTYKLLVALTLSVFISSTADFAGLTTFALAEETAKNNVEIKKPPVRKFKNAEMFEILESLKNTVAKLEERVVNLENKIDENNQKESKKDNSTISSKWSNFAKAEKSNQEVKKDNEKATLAATEEKSNEFKKDSAINEEIVSQSENKEVATSKENPDTERFEFNISVKKATNKNQEIGVVLIGDKTVIAYRAAANGIGPFERAKIVAKRLERFLTNKGDVTKLKPVQKNGIYTGSADQILIFTVDEETAKMSAVGAENLALAWVNNIRDALGVAKIKASVLKNAYNKVLYKNILAKNKKKPSMFSKVASRSFDRTAYTNIKEDEGSPIIQILIPLDQLSIASSNKSSKIKAKNTPISLGNGYLGYASWYGPGFNGRRAADGSRFNMNSLTAAHKTLPFGTVVKVTNMNNNRICYVRITDRGPFIHGRIIDLSRGAASQIGMLGSGVAKVKVEVLKK